MYFVSNTCLLWKTFEIWVQCNFLRYVFFYFRYNHTFCIRNARILQTYLEQQHLVWLYIYCILNQSVTLLAFIFQSQVDIFSILLSNFVAVLPLCLQSYLFWNWKQPTATWETEMQDVFVFRRNAQRNRQLAQTPVLDDHSPVLNHSL